MYVAVLKTLQTLLKNETVLSEVNQKLHIDQVDNAPVIRFLCTNSMLHTRMHFNLL